MPSPLGPSSLPGDFVAGVPTELMFAIAAGVYVAGVWTRTYTDSSEELAHDTIGTGGGGAHTVAFALMDGSGGVRTDYAEVTAQQLVDINGVAGGTLDAWYTFNGLAGTQVLSALTLTLFTSSGEPMSNGIITADGVNFAEGYLYATSAAVAEGGANAVVFAKLSDITIKDTLSLKELPGPESLGATAVAGSERKITITAKFAAIKGMMLAALRGCERTLASGVTTVSSGVNDQPVPFTAQFMTPVDGSGEEWIFYNCVCPDFSRELKLHDYGMTDVTFNCYGNLAASPPIFYSVLLPGDQTL